MAADHNEEVQEEDTQAESRVKTKVRNMYRCSLSLLDTNSLNDADPRVRVPATRSTTSTRLLNEITEVKSDPQETHITSVSMEKGRLLR